MEFDQDNSGVFGGIHIIQSCLIRIGDGYFLIWVGSTHFGDSTLLFSWFSHGFLSFTASQTGPNKPEAG